MLSRFAVGPLLIEAGKVLFHEPYAHGHGFRIVLALGHFAVSGLPSVAPSPVVYWGSAVGLVVVGHLVAVVAAHLASRELFGVDAARGHAPLVALMVGYTVLSLWILSRPVGG